MESTPPATVAARRAAPRRQPQGTSAADAARIV